MKKSVVIVAGGRGLRMGTEVPKQFLKVNNKEIILHTIEKFRRVLPQAELVLVLPKEEHKRWREVAEGTAYQNLKIAEGGESRFESVQSGLKMIGNDCLVAIHDGVRPLVSEATILRVFEKAEESGACIPVDQLRDSVRRLEGENSQSIDRSVLRLVQTPQCFHSKLLKQAYQQPYQQSFTDDASVVESIGVKISLVEGNPENIKVTYPFDLTIAESLLS